MARRGFWESFLDLVFGESARPEADRPLLGAPMLANWLPYRSYDAKSGLFINTESLGFILELAPMMGADERSGEILTQFLSDAVPAGCEIQLIHWQSPSVGERIADWVMPRVVAKGLDLLALKIRDLAREAKVPVLQAPPLARALYAACELEQEIPARLFSAVAQVLAWVYALRDAAAAGRIAINEAPMPEVPADMDPHAKHDGAFA